MSPANRRNVYLPERVPSESVKATADVSRSHISDEPEWDGERWRALIEHGRHCTAALTSHGALPTMTVMVGGRPRFETGALNTWAWTLET
jgi:hypothetical protein